MKTEGSSLKRKTKTNGGRTKGCGRRARRRAAAAAAASETEIQRLFEACKAVFEGPGTVPRPLGVKLLQLLLDQMKPEDVGLSAEILFFKANKAIKETPTITYTTIYSCDNFSICLFFLPPNAVIPLHNHPEMTVFTKLLLGSMHIKSYDWVESVQVDEPATKSRLARLVVDSDFTAPCNTSILYPTSGGNMHAFTAITPCVVLDVLGPPYSNNGRDCTYYREHPYSSIQDAAAARAGGLEERLGWLEEMDVPDDLKMDGVKYQGPQITDGR